MTMPRALSTTIPRLFSLALLALLAARRRRFGVARILSASLLVAAAMML